MIDTHSHIYGEEFDGDREEVVRRAIEAGVERVLLCNVDLDTVARMKKMHEEKPDFTEMAMGLHPTEIKEEWKSDLQKIGDELFSGGYKAIGEIGMDLYWDKTYEKEQREVLIEQMAWARELNMPVVLHIRKAYAEVFEEFKKINLTEWQGVFHCFGGGIEEARKAVKMGFMLGIGGVLTYKNSGLGDIVREIGAEHLLLETDAPYLAPVPYRGKRNEPAFMASVRDKMGEILGRSAQEIDEITTANARKTFRL